MVAGPCDRSTETLFSELEALLAKLRHLSEGEGGGEGGAPGGEALLGLLARRLYEERAARRAFLPPNLLGEPAWDILLDLLASEHENRSISVSSACIASGAPPTTGLRYIARLEQERLLERVPALGDRRRCNLRLTPGGKAAMLAALKRIAAQRPLSGGCLGGAVGIHVGRDAGAIDASSPSAPVSPTDFIPDENVR